MLLDALVIRMYTHARTLVTVKICSRGLVDEQGGLQDTHTRNYLHTIL